MAKQKGINKNIHQHVTGAVPTNSFNKDENQLFVTWKDEKEFEKALSNLTDKDGNYGTSINRDSDREFSSAYYYRDFRNIDNNVSVRSGFTRQDYSFFRPSERVPRKTKEIISWGMIAYERVGIVKNIIDLMAEFACQGIDIVHPDPHINAKYKAWWKKTKIPQRSERFCNLLYRCGNVIVKRMTGKLTNTQMQTMKYAIGAKNENGGETSNKPDFPVSVEQNLPKYDIPVKYFFLNPLLVDVLEPDLAIFLDQPIYGITLAMPLLKKITNPTSMIERKLVAKIPASIKDLAANNQNNYGAGGTFPYKAGTQKMLPLNPDKIAVFHYKKDDWMIWAYPMTYAIIDDLMLLEKMKLADLTALDGAISSVRLWKLGNIENKMLPTRAAINKLASILIENVGGGCYDLIWGPDIELVESQGDISKFLGADKYTATLQHIYMGLGIPPTLNSGGDQQNGFSSNFISIKTLIERLKYGRQVLLDWLNLEISLVQKAFMQVYGDPKYKIAPHITFDKVTMTDETQELKLYMDLFDRNVISEETILRRFGEIPMIEHARKKKEAKLRKSGKLGEKAGPWHDPQFERKIMQIFAQSGEVTPQQLGIELEEDDSPSPQDKNRDVQLKGIKHANTLREETKRMQLQQQGDVGKKAGDQAKTKGQPGQGRPNGQKDTEQRKKKVVRPQTGKSIGEDTTDFIKKFAWARDAQKAIADILEPKLLDFYQRKDLRSMTTKEFEESENFKFGVLFNIEPLSNVNHENVLKVVSDRKLKLHSDAKLLYKNLINEVIEQTGKEPKIDKKRDAQCMVYAILK